MALPLPEQFAGLLWLIAASCIFSPSGLRLVLFHGAEIDSRGIRRDSSRTWIRDLRESSCVTSSVILIPFKK